MTGSPLVHLTARASMETEVSCDSDRLLGGLERGASDSASRAVRAAPRRPDAEVSTGAPDHEIVSTAEAIAADLVVLGSHGWPALDTLLFGTTARGVIGAVRCPVLTVKAPVKAHLRSTRHASAAA